MFLSIFFDFPVIEADFPTENHLAALLEYRGYDEEMDGIDDYYIELHKFHIWSCIFVFLSIFFDFPIHTAVNRFIPVFFSHSSTA